MKTLKVKRKKSKRMSKNYHKLRKINEDKENIV